MCGQLRLHVLWLVRRKLRRNVRYMLHQLWDLSGAVYVRRRVLQLLLHVRLLVRRNVRLVVRWYVRLHEHLPAVVTG
jgi:hypothetical protein